MTTKPLIVWSLFDSGNSSYKQAIEKYFTDQEFINYSIGIDKEQRENNNRFINLDLANYKSIFGDTSMFDALDTLPKPDIILASPPCESFSIASAMKGGNRYYRWDSGEMVPSTATRITSNNNTPYKAYVDKTFYTRINGELCAFNTTQIIQRYQPQAWFIENPQSSHIWYYLEHVYNFTGTKNTAHYAKYDTSFSKKPTSFLSNLTLDLKKMSKGEKAEIIIGSPKNGDKRKQIRGYNNRSSIPLPLIADILIQARGQLLGDEISKATPGPQQ